MGCYNSWANLRCSSCSPLGEKSLWNGTIAVFYLKFFEHPSFGQVAHEIYPSEWKVHSSEISITIMYCWYMFLMAVATDFTHVTINLVCCCLSPVLISHKRSCWKISQSQTHMIGCWNARTAFFLKSISAAEMPVKFQSNQKTRRGLAKNCDRTSYVILNQPQYLFSVQQTQVW